ncbi:hypothetical protein MPSI1_004015 [Malassezia psittaci]|uniref:GATA-type domain-containing protein n=1 Tax=Malassezia psittaci TaxID=1821823 RepID=A0AAF0F9X7_9BASI|nr:hypothetical protein MPSI1_004015 [Malassezia psittaci]
METNLSSERNHFPERVHGLPAEASKSPILAKGGKGAIHTEQLTDGLSPTMERSAQVTLPPLASLTEIDGYGDSAYSASASPKSRGSPPLLLSRMDSMRTRDDWFVRSRDRELASRNTSLSNDWDRRMSQREDYLSPRLRQVHEFDHLRTSRLPGNLSLGAMDHLPSLTEMHPRQASMLQRSPEAWRHGRPDRGVRSHSSADLHAAGRLSWSMQDRSRSIGDSSSARNRSMSSMPALRGRTSGGPPPEDNDAQHPSTSEPPSLSYGHSTQYPFNAADADGPLNEPRYFRRSFPNAYASANFRAQDTSSAPFTESSQLGYSNNYEHDSVHHHPSNSNRMPSVASKKRAVPSAFLDPIQGRDSTPKSSKTTKSSYRASNSANHVCQVCQATATPEWRKGPSGPRTLCNACGLLYAKICRKKEQDAIAVALANGRESEDARKEVAEELLQPNCRAEILEALRNGVRVTANAKQNRLGLVPPSKNA